jgi:hypothetical protein
MLLHKEEKFSPFCYLFSLISNDKPMINYEHMNKSFHFLNVQDFPKLYWFNTIGGGGGVCVATCMHELVVNKIKDLVQAISFISLSCDEVTTMDQ